MFKPDSKRTKADLILLSITIIWGTTFVIVKDALHFISPLIFQGVRFAIAAIIVGLFTLKYVKNSTAITIKHGVFLGLLLGIGFGFQTIGLQITSASKSAFITGMMVVFTPLLQLVIERRKPTKGNVAGIMFVAMGLYLLTSPAGSTFNFGDFLTVCCAIIFAFYIVYLDIFTRDSFPREIVFHQMLVTSILGFALSPFLEQPKFIPDSSALTGLIYTAIFASAINTFLQSKYQRDTTPTRAAIIFAVEPVVATIFAFIVLHEVLPALSIFGGALIISGLLVSELT